jgi:hypothetical protein
MMYLVTAKILTCLVVSFSEDARQKAHRSQFDECLLGTPASREMSGVPSFRTLAQSLGRMVKSGAELRIPKFGTWISQ